MNKYIPSEIEWLLAEMVQEFTFSNEDGPLVWINTILINAASLEDGYQKALQFGEQYNDTYLNSDKVQVVTRFRGLRNLFLIHEKLEHGAEVLYEERRELTEDQITQMLKAKEQLAVFREAETERPE